MGYSCETRSMAAGMLPLLLSRVLLVAGRTSFLRLVCALRPRPPARRAGTSALEQMFAQESLRNHLAELERRGNNGADHVTPLLLPLLQQLRVLEADMQETMTLIQDDNKELKDLAESELVSCKEKITHLKRQIIMLLVPSEETDESDLIMEITAGVGGQEAMLFTAEMFEMYQRYAAYKRWSFEYFKSELGGLRHATASVAGHEAYKQLKFEGGVHRVQRVPKTEKQGRVHTSTMSVAILPQPNEINLKIFPKDLRIETKRATGAGGQHVNTTDSAVRIVHIPTGVVSECQQERSQIQNKEKAMKVLRAKLYSLKLDEEMSKRHNARKIQVGTKGRSEKIRTYNFPQGRITDHRISKSLYDLEGFMSGEEPLDEMIQSLREYADYETLKENISEKN